MKKQDENEKKYKVRLLKLFVVESCRGKLMIINKNDIKKFKLQAGQEIAGILKKNKKIQFPSIDSSNEFEVKQVVKGWKCDGCKKLWSNPFDEEFCNDNFNFKQNRTCKGRNYISAKKEQNKIKVKTV